MIPLATASCQKDVPAVNMFVIFHVFFCLWGVFFFFFGGGGGGRKPPPVPIRWAGFYDMLDYMAPLHQDIVSHLMYIYIYICHCV